MSKSIQEVIMASIQAEDAGCIIDWKRTCLEVVNAFQAAQAPKEEKVDQLDVDFLTEYSDKQGEST